MLDLRLAIGVFLCALVCGCATVPEYNPVQVSQEQVFMLNGPLKSLSVGMSRDEAHRRMGEAVVIGYNYDNKAAKPITIPNPYKSKDIKTDQGTCTAEYYVTAVRRPDGVVTDEEMTPLVFCNGVLTQKGRQDN